MTLLSLSHSCHSFNFVYLCLGSISIFTTKKDIKTLTADELRHKIQSVLKEDNSEQDSDEESEQEDTHSGDEDENEKNEESLVYKLGLTSGSKLVDT